MQLKLMRKEIAQFLQAGQEAIARIRVEHIIREQNIVAAYGILELFCEFVLARVPILESQNILSMLNIPRVLQSVVEYLSSLQCFIDVKFSGDMCDEYYMTTLELPIELKEAIASIIFSATRCSEVPDLLQLKNLFAAKYGKEFVAAVSELRPDSGVNRTIIEKLSVNAPPGEEKLKVLKEIAREYDLDWDSSNAEAEFNKKHEDLLAGSGMALSQSPARQDSQSQPSNNTRSNTSNDSKKISQPLQAPRPVNEPSLRKSEIESSPFTDSYAEKTIDFTNRIPSRPSDVMEKARNAIAAADRATAAARAAAQLANIKPVSFKVEGTSS
ncbi:hypothetical protein ACFE04_018835 [Oxalis oulophora]